MSNYLAIWHDQDELPRAWGSASTKDEAEAMADIQAEEYLKSRPDVVLCRRVTHEFIAEGISIDVASLNKIL